MLRNLGISLLWAFAVDMLFVLVLIIHFTFVDEELLYLVVAILRRVRIIATA